MDDMTATDHREVCDTVQRMGWYQDGRRWDDLAEVLADEVLVDYSDGSGGSRLRREVLVDSWRSSLEPMTHTQHLLTGLLVHVEGDQATATCNETVWLARAGQAGGDLYNFGTRMALRLERAGDGWRIDRLQVVPGWSGGNAAVLGDWTPPDPT